MTASPQERSTPWTLRRTSVPTAMASRVPLGNYVEQVADGGNTESYISVDLRAWL